MLELGQKQQRVHCEGKGADSDAYCPEALPVCMDGHNADILWFEQS